MENLKYLKSLLYIFIPVLIFNVLLTTLYYFNIMNSTVMNYLKLIIMMISMLVGGVYIGKKASKKGWLEGIKIGLEVIVLFFIISYLAFDQGLTGKTFIYYFLILASAVFGSMIGISRKKSNE